MSDEANVHPAAGADDKSQLWNEMEKADVAGPSLDDTSDLPENIGSDGSDIPTENDPAPQEAADKDTPAEDGTAAAAPDATDIWAEAPPELRAAFDATREELNDTQQKYQRVSGTVSGQQRKLNQQGEEIAALKNAKDTPDNGASEDDGDNEDPANNEKWDTFNTDYPEIAGPVKNIIDGLEARINTLGTENTSLKTELGSISQDRQDQNIEEQYQFVKDAHSDYDVLKGSSEFTDFYNVAPAYIKAGIERNAVDVLDGAEVTHIVSVFKSETGWQSPVNAAPGEESAGADKPNQAAQNPKRTHQLESAASPPAKGPAKVSDGLPDANDKEASWDYFERKDAEREKRAASN